MQQWITLNYARDMARAVSIKYDGQFMKEFKYLLTEEGNDGVVIMKSHIGCGIYIEEIPSKNISILVEVVEKVVDFNLNTPTLPVFYTGELNNHFETPVVEWHYIQRLKQVAIMFEYSSTLHLVPMTTLHMKELSDE